MKRRSGAVLLPEKQSANRESGVERAGTERVAAA